MMLLGACMVMIYRLLVDGCGSGGSGDGRVAGACCSCEAYIIHHVYCIGLVTILPPYQYFSIATINSK